MTYESIADIYAANEVMRRRLVSRVENLSEAQQTFRPSEGAWSIAEIMEHLSIIEQSMVRLIGMLLQKSETVAAAAAATVGDGTVQTAPRFQPFSLAAHAETIKDKKLTAPEQVRPGGQIPLADSLAAMQASRAALEALRERFEAAGDLSAATYPHPAFGPLDAAQWLAFIGLHEARHLRQIEQLIAAPDFAGRN